MSNHLHMIAKTENESLNEVLGNFKSYTAKELIKMIGANQQESRQKWVLYFNYFGKRNSQNQEYQFWQNGNHAVELYSPQVITQKLAYLHNNPVKQGIVAKPEDYLYSSANEFSEVKVLTL
jgi:putative transposase